jgi:hypothetical protein
MTFWLLKRLVQRYDQMAGPPPPIVEPRYQLVPCEKESQYLGASPPTGTLAAYAGAQQAAGQPTATGLDATVAAHVDRHGRGVQPGTDNDASGAALAASQEAATAAATARGGPSPYC